MYILFDIGATRMRIAVSRGGAPFEKKSIKVVQTPKKFSRGMAQLESFARELIGGKKITGIAGGVAGSFDVARARIFCAPNLPDWSGKPIKKTLQKIFKTKNVFLENDTALAGLGEALYGAGRGKRVVAYMTASTGVNGARIVDKTIDRNVAGFEIGHQILGTKKTETLEYFVGAHRLSRRFGKPAAQIRSGAIWKRANEYFSVGVYNAILFWSPHVVVLGGGLIEGGHITVLAVKKNVKKILTNVSFVPPIKRATLGSFGGIYGALAFLNQRRSS